MILSKYFKFRKKQNIAVMFHELHPNPMYLDSNDLDKLLINRLDDLNLSNEAFYKMLENKLIIYHNCEDIAECNASKKILERKLNHCSILYLIITRNCNLKCDYCPIANDSGISMTLEIVKRSIDLWKNHMILENKMDCNKEYCLLLYGGEPLLEQELIKNILEIASRELYALSRNNKLDFYIFSNGTILNNSMVSIMKKYRVKVCIGLDGVNFQDNIHRINKQNKLDQLLSNIKIFKNNKIDLYASVTVSPENIDDLVDLSKGILELGIEKIGFNYMRGRSILRYFKLAELEDFYQRTSKAIIDVSKKTGHSDYQVEKKLYAFNNKDWFPVDCTCYGNQIVVHPNGMISNCPFYPKNLGYLNSLNNDYIVWKDDYVNLWRTRYPLENTHYEKYDFKSLCGAGCAWNSQELFNDLYKPDPASITLGKEVFDEIIWSKINQENYIKLEN